MKIFVDTSPFIYLIEEHPSYVEKIQTFFIEKLIDDDEFITSVITLSEFGVKPYRDNKLEFIVNLKEFLSRTGIPIKEVNLNHADRSASLRGKYRNLKGMDSLQIAIAIEEGCNQFLTNDKRLRSIDELEVILVSEL